MGILQDQEKLRARALKHRETVERSREIKSTLSSDVEAFLANGGKIEKMRDCSVGEAKYKSMKPYQITKKDGTTYIKRYNVQTGTQKVPDVLRGHRSK
jgi:hypothetical protein